MKIKLVLFDLDGTLLDSLEDLYNTVNETLEYFGFQTISPFQAREYVGNGMKKLVERSLPDNSGENVLLECLDHFVKRYSENMKKHTKPFDGVLEMLEKLKLDGVKTAVISNKNRDAAAALCSAHFGTLIDLCLGVDKNFLPKPDLSMAFEAARFFDVRPEECVVAGDGETDIKTAKAFGSKSIAALWGFRSKQILEKENPDFYADKPQEILCILQNNIDL